MTYYQVNGLLNGDYHCTSIKDSNGNTISVEYNLYAEVTRVTDTLGRQIDFHYDSNLRLTSITQARHGVADYALVTFGYAAKQIYTNFRGPSNNQLATPGVTQGQTMALLSQVGLADGSRYNFTYTTWGQVSLIEHRAKDEHLLGRTAYNLPADASSPQPHCPRFTERREWAQSWNGDTDGVPTPAEESVYTFTTSPTGEWHAVTAPDGTQQREYYYEDSANLDWRRGLLQKAETYDTSAPGSPLVRTVESEWAQDNTTVAYRLNPRVTRVSVTDPQGHIRVTRMEHAAFGLVSDVYEYDSNGTTVLRRAHTDYELSEAYVSRRIIGLVKESYVFGKDPATSTEKLYAKTINSYDEGGEFLVNQGEPVQHDGQGYGPDLVQGRGLLTGVRRWDVTDEYNLSKSVRSRVGYNTSGSAVFTRDPLGHQVSMSYTDSFSDGSHPATLSYPTTVTDPDGFSSTRQYDYDLGLPALSTDPKGAGRKTEYDRAGRPTKASELQNGTLYSYTRWVYPDKLTYVSRFTTVNDLSAEAFSITVFDGAGRVRATAQDKPDGMTQETGSRYAAQYVSYDRMGRPAKESNPAEVGSTWVASAEDAAGWLYTRQTFDWKGRPLVATGTDGATVETKYGGCGCAGGESVTTRDEVGRRQRVTYDVLGRMLKSQVLTQQDKNAEFTVSPTEAPYSTVTNTYDALDRVTEVRERAEATSAEQVTTMEYDGHGRLKRRRLPQYESNKFTTYAYNDDDTLASMTDARLAVTAYSYEGNNRQLIKSVTHTLAGSDTINVTYQYDAAGNRTRMDDGQGWATYEYDTLSRLTEEKRHFNGLSANPRNPYKLSYTYTTSGKLKTLTDSFGAQFTYGFDPAGQLRDVKDVTGSAYAGVTTYAANVQYRAWGGVKSASFGDGGSQTTAYDSRMRPSRYRMAGGASALREDFTYYADGRLQHITDLDDGTRQTSPRYQTMSRAYTYDHVGRVKEAGGHAPAEPGGNTGSPNWPSPYVQFYGYDEFGNMNYRSGTYGYRMSQTDPSSYVNNRRQGWDYDAGGRVTHSTDPNGSERTWSYDAAGRLVTTAETAAGVTKTLTQAYDGDGQVVYSSNGSTAGTDYEVRSSVLDGEVVTRLTQAGEKGYTYVPARGLVRARQVGSNSSGQPAVEWSHPDPVGVTESGFGLAAYDPLGNYAGLPEPPPQSGPWPQPSGYYGPIWGGAGSLFSNVNNFSSGCLLDGRPADCNRVSHYREDGWANPQGSRTVEDGQRIVHIEFDPMPMGSPNGGGGLVPFYVPGGQRRADGSGDGGTKKGPNGEDVIITNHSVTPGGFWTLLPYGSIGEIASIGPLFVTPQESNQSGVSDDCLAALVEAQTDASAVDRAYANVDMLNNVARETGIGSSSPSV